MLGERARDRYLRAHGYALLPILPEYIRRLSRIDPAVIEVAQALDSLNAAAFQG